MARLIYAVEVAGYYQGDQRDPDPKPTPVVMQPDKHGRIRFPADTAFDARELYQALELLFGVQGEPAWRNQEPL